MVAVSPFHTYVIGAERPVGLYLTRLLAKENLYYKALSLGGEERLSEQSSGQPFFVILPSLNVPGDLDAADYWISVAREHDAPIVLLSSLQVYGCAGLHDGETFSELDEKYCSSMLEQRVLETENRVRECSRHLILRVGTPFSIQPGDISHQIMTAIRDDRSITLDSQVRFNPTSDDDTAMVLAAILKQADCVDSLWGTYHFAGTDGVTLYDFGEALVAEASQYEDLSDVRLNHGDSESLLLQVTACSDVSKLFYHFGIQHKPWRKGLSRVLSQHYRGNKG